MLHIKLFFIRKIKGLALKIGLHRLIGPFSNILLTIVYLSGFSRFRKNNANLGFNDFYNDNVTYEDRFKLHEYIFKSEKVSGPVDYYEFGVAEGLSFQWWVKKNNDANSRFFGFDTFTGLPEDFGVMKKDDYDTKGSYPDVGNDKRCKFISGLFQDSLLPFIKTHEWGENRKIIHLDADLYTATLFVLTMLYPYLHKGDIIMFDEFGVPTHEFKAFSDFSSAFYFEYEVLGAVNNYLQLAIKVK